MIEAFVISRGSNIIRNGPTAFSQAVISTSSDNDKGVNNKATIDLGYLPNIGRQGEGLNITDDENKVIASPQPLAARIDTLPVQLNFNAVSLVDICHGLFFLGS